MLKEELYKKTTNILFDAYFNNTLRHGICTACAVGNIVAANMGLKMVEYQRPFGNAVIMDLFWEKDGYIMSSHWEEVFMTAHKIQSKNEEEYEGLAKRQIDSTGYSVNELARMEFAFETAEKGENDEDWMYNGLVAVIDVLNDIHQVDHDEEKSRFTEHYKKKLAAA